MTVSKALDRAGLEVRLPPTPPQRPSRRGRRIALASVGVILIGLGFLALKQALGVRDSLERGRALMETARDGLMTGDTAEAARAFSGGGAAFEEARGGLGSFPLSAVGLVPGPGNTTRTLGAIADAGMEVVAAGEDVVSRIDTLPGGFSALSPTDGRIDPEPLGRLAPSIADAAEHLRRARTLVEESPDSLLPSRVREARVESLAVLASLEESLDTAGGLLTHLHELLGVEAPTRYFVAAQNPAELRGTGGLIGAYSILEVDDGRFTFADAAPIQDLPDLPVEEVRAPSPEYAEHYDRFGGAGFWRNMNMTPDFPSAAAAIAGAYRQVEGVRLDGVIAMDPHALREMLEVTGPIEVERFGEVDADSVVPLITNEAYLLFDDLGSRKAALGLIAFGVITAFLDHSEGDLEWLRALTSSADGGHLLLWHASPDVQTQFERSGAAGSLSQEPGDRLAIVQNNGGGNKLDFYLDRRIRYTVQLAGNGSAEATVEIFLENDAPDAGLPRYVIGPYPGASEAGENVSFLSTYCATRCQLREAVRDGRRIRVEQGTERGWRFYRDHLRIPSGGAATLRLDLGLKGVWSHESGLGVYRLTFLDQPTIRPSHVEIRVVVPPDVRASTTTPGARVIGDQVVWTGNPTRIQELEVTFGA